MMKIPYKIIYSPKDDDRLGKGWYAQIFDLDGSLISETDLLSTKEEASEWVKERGGNFPFG